MNNYFRKFSRAALLMALVGSTFGNLTAREHWHVYDALGNTVVSMNADAIVAAVESTAFGESRSPSAGARFTGKPYDADLGAHVFPFRNYRASEARWMSIDPSGFPDGVNARYYSPSVFSELDPLGLAKHLLWLFMTSGAANDPAIGEYQTGFSDYYDVLNAVDTETASTSTPSEYLSDGDSFSFIATSNFDFLSTMSEFTQVFVVAHGINYGTEQNPVYNGTYLIGGVEYTQSQIVSSSSNIAEFHGCGSPAAGGTTTYTSNVISDWKNPTREHLYE